MNKLTDAASNSAEIHLKQYLDSLSPANGDELAVMCLIMMNRAAMLLAQNGGVAAAHLALDTVKRSIKA